MHILTDQWQDGFLDYALEPESYRIRVRTWCVLSPIESMYYVRLRDWRMVWNYLREDGPVQVMRKIRSRNGEGERNEKFVSCGVGEIIAAGDTALVGRQVLFVAPAHPRCVERVVVRRELCRFDEAPAMAFPSDVIVFWESKPPLQLPDVEKVKGFSTFSGNALPDCSALLEQVRDLFRNPAPISAQLLPVSAGSVVQESFSPQLKSSSNGRLKGALFGYGHYAKTNIIPNVSDTIEVTSIHELDPTQLGPASALPFTAETTGNVHSSEHFDVYFLAGYHHTHAPLAAEAVRRGAWAVIEKPIATTANDLDDLLGACRKAPSRVLIGFQRRYSDLTRIALHELQAGNGEPVNFFSIVHEVPLPEHHWYRWPNSGSRALSNGCHWVDLFLYCNAYNRPREITTWQSTTGEMVIAMELENSATFSLALNESGSSRIGIEEYVEMRRADVTARITNNTHLVTENSSKILRRATVPRLNSFARMYREFARRIAAGEPGDSLQSIEISGRTVLQIEELLDRKRLSRTVLR
jgi:predicted dehydrogenase